MRIHRIGQKAEVVRVRKFVVQDSVEEKIVKLQFKKKVSSIYAQVPFAFLISQLQKCLLLP